MAADAHTVAGISRYGDRILLSPEAVNRQALTCDLRVEQCYDEELRRHVRMARLLDPGTPCHAKQLPTLLDVRLIGMSPSAFSLSGFERVEGVEYAQSWLVQATA